MAREARRVRGTAGGSSYCLQNAVRLLHHIVVPEAQYTAPMGFEPLGALRIVLRSIGMLAAINLDHQTKLLAEEVQNIGSERRLTTELQAAQPTIAQP